MRTVDSVKLALLGNGTDVELRAAPDGRDVGTDRLGRLLRRRSRLRTGAGTTVELTPDEPVQTRYLLVWLTSLPEVSSGKYRGAIADIEVLGE